MRSNMVGAACGPKPASTEFAFPPGPPPVHWCGCSAGRNSGRLHWVADRAAMPASAPAVASSTKLASIAASVSGWFFCWNSTPREKCRWLRWAISWLNTVTSSSSVWAYSSRPLLIPMTPPGTAKCVDFRTVDDNYFYPAVFQFAVGNQQVDEMFKGSHAAAGRPRWALAAENTQPGSSQLIFEFRENMLVDDSPRLGNLSSSARIGGPLMANNMDSSTPAPVCLPGDVSSQESHTEGHHHINAESDGGYCTSGSQRGGKRFALVFGVIVLAKVQSPSGYGYTVPPFAEPRHYDHSPPG